MGFICSSIKMAVMVLSLLLLLQLPLIFASGLSNTKACGTYHLTYSERSGHELFYLNKKLVNRDLFCKAINVYNTRHCFIPRNVRSHCCEVDRSSDGLLVKAGRRLLRNVVREETQGEQKGEGEKTKDDQESLLTPRSLSIAVPGFFLLCCAFLCPCFRARKKETGHNVLSKDQSPMDSVSSLEMNSVSEKVPPASPMRAPGSPMRVPASPMRVPPSPSRFSMSPKLNRVGSVHLNMSQVARATQNFSPSLRLGEGGFGTVYKANLQDGQVVAIKRAKKEHFEALQTEFRSEVEVLAKIDHRNLVKLLGYVERGNERLLITEYVPNGTLREHLDGAHGSYLDFNQRLEISIDVAHALTYLHMYAEKQIIHRDVKSSNILLTENLRAKVADFGFAKSDDLDNDKTHVSTKVRGTIGYLDPEYMRTYQLTPKSDVYSFGVLLIEIITGRRPVELKRPPEERVTIRWAFKRYNEGRVMDLVDTQLNESVNQEILQKMLGLAIQCAAPTRADRPEMKSVGEQLWLIRMDYMKSARAT